MHPFARLDPRASRRCLALTCTCVTLLGAITVAGCGSSNSNASAKGGGSSTASSGGHSSGGAYHVGASMMLQPAAIASYGTDMTGGMQAYFKYVNAHGGINGKQVDLDTANGGVDVATTDQSLKTLVEQDHDIVVGGLLDPTGSQGAHAVIDDLKTTVLEGSPNVQDVDPPTSQYFYGGGGPLYPDDANIEVNFARQQVIKTARPKIAIVYEISTQTAAYEAEMKKLAAQYGWDVVNVTGYQVGTTSFASQASTLAAAHPQYIFATFDQSNFAFVKALQAAGVKAPIFSNQGGPSSQQLAQLNYPGLYVERSYAFPNSSASVMKTYLARLKQYGGGADPTINISQYGYVQAEIIAAVLKKCGADCTTQSFNATISKMPAIPTGGFTLAPVTYTATDRAGLQTNAFYTYKNGKVVQMPHLYTWPQG